MMALLKKFAKYALFIFGLVFIYFWYVRGINILLDEEERVWLPPYNQFAVRLPPKPQEGLLGQVWSTALAMPSPRTNVAAATVGDRIYVVGGIDGFARTVATVEAFNVSEGSWTKLQDLPQPLHHVALVAYGNSLYALGGLEGLSSTPTDSVYVFDTKTGTWSEGKSMPTAVGAAAAVVDGDFIHVLGGQVSGGASDTHLIYDIKEKKWSWGESLVSARAYHGAAISDGGDIIIFGGRAGSLAYNLRSVEMLRRGSSDWESVKPMSFNRSGFAAAQYEGKVYVFGGESAAEVFDRVETYDFASDEWQTVAPLPSSRQGAGAGAVGGKIFVIGGGRHQGVSVSDINEAFIPEAYEKAVGEEGAAESAEPAAGGAAETESGT